MSNMKRFSLGAASALVVVIFMLLSITPAVAQQRVGTIKKPAAPTPMEQKERTIQDLLFFPFSCIEANMSTQESAWQEVKNTFGTCENINGSPGLHANSSFDFSYRGRTIAICFYNWMDDKTWYDFFFQEKKDAEQFYNDMVKDVRAAGIPLTKDKLYGGMSNRKKPVSIFKWVSVEAPVKVKEASPSNIEPADVVGMYKVELSVYKKKRK